MIVHQNKIALSQLSVQVCLTENGLVPNGMCKGIAVPTPTRRSSGLLCYDNVFVMSTLLPLPVLLGNDPKRRRYHHSMNMPWWPAWCYNFLKKYKYKNTTNNCLFHR